MCDHNVNNFSSVLNYPRFVNHDEEAKQGLVVEQQQHLQNAKEASLYMNWCAERCEEALSRKELPSLNLVFLKQICETRAGCTLLADG